MNDFITSLTTDAGEGKVIKREGGQAFRVRLGKADPELLLRFSGMSASKCQACHFTYPIKYSESICKKVHTVECRNPNLR